jgi:hypothetical protein
VLRKELPADTEVAESLFHAQVALKTTRGEEVSNMKFGGEVETVTSIEQVRAAIHSPGEFSCTNLSMLLFFLLNYASIADNHMKHCSCSIILMQCTSSITS